MMNAHKRLLTVLAASILIIGTFYTKAAAQATGGMVTILYPPSNGIVPAAPGYPSYMAAQTQTNSTCAYSTNSSTAYSAMTSFNDTGGTYHAVVLGLTGSGPFTYYVQCQDNTTGDLTPVESTTFTQNLTNNTNIAGDVIAIATSPTSVLLAWGNPGPLSQSFLIYRSTSSSSLGTLVGTDTWAGQLNWLDTGLTPGTLYWYSIVDVFTSGNQPPSLAVPAMTEQVTTNSNSAPTVTLNDFESGSDLVLNNADPYPDGAFLWSNYPQCDNSGTDLCDGLATITNFTSHTGNYSLEYNLHNFAADFPNGSTYEGVGYSPGNFPLPHTPYLQFSPVTPDDLWHYANQFLTNGTWQADTYNRMVFWVKIPTSYAACYDTVNTTPGEADIDIGTFVSSSHANKSTSADGSESGFGGHFYHEVLLPPSNVWMKVVMDTHPTHQRQAAGGFEEGNMPYPTGEQGFNYFDALTRFYFDMGQCGVNLNNYPSTFYFDDFQFYKDPNPDNVDQVFGMSGFYDPTDNEVYVSWQHPKNDGNTIHEVRYSFTDFYSLPGATPLDQWNNGIPVPAGTSFGQPVSNGILSPPNLVFNEMEYHTTGINVSGQNTIYIAILPQGASTFNEISLPVPPAVVGAPVISSFIANPAIISSGASSELSWNVSGATSVTINNGVGDVTSTFSTNVSPQSSTTYTLTAANNSGSVTKNVTVAVNAASTPAVSLTSISAVYATAPTSIGLSAWASEANGSIASVVFNSSSPGLEAVCPNNTCGTLTGSPYFVFLNNVPAGTYSFTATATDASNASTTSSPIIVTVGGASASTPMVSLTTNQTSYTAPANVVLMAAALESNGTITKVVFNSESCSNNICGIATSSPYTITMANMPIGTYSFTATATDANNVTATSTPPTDVTVDPVSSLQVSAGNTQTITLPATASLSGSATDSNPSATLSTTWSMSSGPAGGTVTFSPSANVLNPTAAFSMAGTYVLTLTATDGTVGGTSSSNVTIIVNPSNATPPSVPTNLNAVAISAMQVNLTWTPSTDNVPVAGYNIFCNGTQVGTSTSASYSDTGLQATTTYLYTVSAYDGAGNTSAQSSAVNVTTPVLSISPDGSVLNAGSGGYLETSAGTWTLSSSTGNYGNLVILNGNKITGQAILLLVYNNGQVYSYNNEGMWYVWNGSNWINISADPQPLPIISSFIATPTSIANGASSTISWSVSGASSVSINNGVGVVTNLTSASVSPTASTNYTLTATNTAGSVTQSAMVTVSGSSTPIAYGDLNGAANGAVTIYDAELVAQYAVGLITLTPTQLQEAMVSSATEKSPTVYDAYLIAEYAVGLITKFPVQS